jgi:hypothetical protein
MKITRYFQLKLHFAIIDLAAIFNELKILFEKENYFDKSIIFNYYFGKFFRLFIYEWETDNSGNFKSKFNNIVALLKDKDEAVFTQIFNVY